MTATRLLTVAPDVDVAHDPLRGGATAAGLDLDAIMLLDPPALLEPYRTLLVHEGSMTTRLEHHFGGRAMLKVMSVAFADARYTRWVLLFDATGRCLELGGVSLDLRRFGGSLRADILEGDEPLGRLLLRYGLAYESVPHAFFAVSATTRLKDLLQMKESRHVFGRRTDLRVGGRKLGDVLELLPCYDAQTVRARDFAWSSTP